MNELILQNRILQLEEENADLKELLGLHKPANFLLNEKVKRLEKEIEVLMNIIIEGKLAMPDNEELKKRIEEYGKQRPEKR